MENLSELVELHANQFSKMGMPSSLWRKAIENIVQEVYLSTSNFTVGLIKSDDDDEDQPLTYRIYASQDIDALDNVFLIDNWFTFPLRRLGSFLEDDINLLEKIEQLLGLLPLTNQSSCANGHGSDIDDKLPSDRIDKVYKHMWKFIGSYSLNENEAVVDPSVDNKDELLEPVWYFMDHYGSHISYTAEEDEVNVRICPFIFMPTMASYSLLWVTDSIQEGGLIIREHTLAKNAPTAALRTARMMPWEPEETIEEAQPLFLPNFQEVGRHRNETLPMTNSENTAGSVTLPFLPDDKTHRVFNGHKDVSNYLNCLFFKFVYYDHAVDRPGEEENERSGSDLDAIDRVDADVYFLLCHFKRFDRIVEMQKFINQFPSEHLFHCKDLLAACVIAHALVSSPAETEELELPKWFQMTYNLHYDLPRFVYDWNRRRTAASSNGNSAEDLNVWILKPWNMSRGACSYVTNNLDQIVRMSETSVPLIAQKYIERPLTFYRPDKQYSVKFDMRIFVVVQSLVPLQAYVYNKYLARLANLEFKLEHFHQYERHFSSMGYLDGGRRCWYMPYEQFREHMLNYRQEVQWDDLVVEAHSSIREMIQCITDNPTIPSRAFQCEYSRAIYGIDVMFKKVADDKYQPVVLEVNFNPDSTMFSTFYPNFHNEYFQLLYMNKMDDENNFIKL